MIKGARRFLLVLLLSPGLASAAEYLSSAERLNGTKTLEALTSVYAKVQGSLVSIGFVSKSDAPIAVGVVVSDDGLIVTKASEYIESSKVRVYTSDGRSYRPTTLQKDQAHDLILLRIPARGLEPVSWGSSKEVALGNWIRFGLWRQRRFSPRRGQREPAVDRPIWWRDGGDVRGGEFGRRGEDR